MVGIFPMVKQIYNEQELICAAGKYDIIETSVPVTETIAHNKKYRIVADEGWP